MIRAMRRVLVALVLVGAAALAVAAVAAAHVERTAYWPNPAPDKSVTPPAGGKVPKARSLASALQATPPGSTRIVCTHRSLIRATKRITSARKNGYTIRPSQPTLHVSKARADSLLKINRELFKRCTFHSIQAALTASHNNDRVVVMPGVYTEPKSRKSPTHDPKCASLTQNGDHGSGGLSYRYQATCPNDQSLLSLIGRAAGKGQEPPPQANRHGIPNLGRCIRCNVQVEGSGATPDDTVVDTGDRRYPRGPNGIGSKKDVGLRIDRADGFVLRNMKFRHAAEHDVYVMETDGYLLDRVQFYYAGEYGALMFATDHGLTENCEAIGNGDSGVYPGGAVDTGEQRLPRRSRASTRRSPAATSTTTRSATRARWATPRTSTTTTSTTTAPGSRPTRSTPAATPATRRTRRCTRTTGSTRTTSTPTRRTRTSSRTFRCRSARAS